MELSSKNLRVIKTCNLYALYFVLGMILVIIGPTLLDLMHIIQTDIKNIAYIIPTRSTGMMLGSITGGIVFDMVAKKQFLFMDYSLILSITTFGVPWSRNMATLLVWTFLQGISMGSLLTGGNIYCLQLWGKKNGPFYQALFFACSVGGLIAPLIATPLLENYTDIDIIKNNTFFKNQNYIKNDTVSEFQDTNFVSFTIPAVTYVYIILSGLALIVTILHFVMCIVAPEDKIRRKSKTSTNKNIKVGTKYYLVLLLLILIFSSYGNEVGYSQMIIIYALKVPLQLSNIIGSYMISAFYAAFTSSRLIAIFLSIKIGSLALIIINLIIVILGSMLLLFFSAYYEWALWISSVLLGVGLAPLIPACTSWVERYITMTHKTGLFFSVSFSISAITIPYTISYYIEKNPYFFAYIIALNSACCVAVVMILFVLIKNLPNKYKVQEIPVTTNNNSEISL